MRGGNLRTQAHVLHIWAHIGFVRASRKGVAIVKQVIVEAGRELVDVNIAAMAGTSGGDISGVGWDERFECECVVREF